MLFSTTTAAFALLTTTATALPWPSQPTSYTPSSSLSKLAKLFPQSALPPPSDTQELKYVLLGIGTQNYTCGSDETAAPGTTGALGKSDFDTDDERH